jgi:hypothetical protein
VPAARAATRLPTSVERRQYHASRADEKGQEALAALGLMAHPLLSDTMKHKRGASSPKVLRPDAVATYRLRPYGSAACRLPTEQAAPFARSATAERCATSHGSSPLARPRSLARARPAPCR